MSARIVIIGEISVTVSNVKDGNTIHTGFLTGTIGGEFWRVTGVEVSLDSGAFQPASPNGFREIGFQLQPVWIFALPTGAAAWRDGSPHTIDVRATDGAGNLSPVTALTVRKGVNNDANGDGYADLAVGAFAASCFAGAAYVFHGSTTGVPGGAATTAATTLTGAASSEFGVSVAL